MFIVVFGNAATHPSTSCTVGIISLWYSEKKRRDEELTAISLLGNTEVGQRIHTVQKKITRAGMGSAAPRNLEYQYCSHPARPRTVNNPSFCISSDFQRRQSVTTARVFEFEQAHGTRKPISACIKRALPELGGGLHSAYPNFFTEKPTKAEQTSVGVLLPSRGPYPINITLSHLLEGQCLRRPWIHNPNHQQLFRQPQPSGTRTATIPNTSHQHMINGLGQELSERIGTQNGQPKRSEKIRYAESHDRKDKYRQRHHHLPAFHLP